MITEMELAQRVSESTSALFALFNEVPPEEVEEGELQEEYSDLYEDWMDLATRVIEFNEWANQIVNPDETPAEGSAETEEETDAGV